MLITWFEYEFSPCVFVQERKLMRAGLEGLLVRLGAAEAGLACAERHAAGMKVCVIYLWFVRAFESPLCCIKLVKI